MNIIREQTIRDFYLKHPDAKDWLITWLAVARKASWRNPHEVQQDYQAQIRWGINAWYLMSKGTNTD